MISTDLDLTDRAVVANPYRFFAEERQRAEVAWHDASGMWLTFTHRAANAVLRDRHLGRIWRDREPTGFLEPFNLLHRNQMMENEPPEHTRLRRLVAAAFQRGHVARMRPRVRELASDLLDEVDPEGFDIIGQYAEPLPVLVISDLLGLPAEIIPHLREWSQSIVKMYEVDPAPHVVEDAVQASTDFADAVRSLARERARDPRSDLLTDLVRASVDEAKLTEDEVVASAVLLLNAGHEASVNGFGNGIVALLRAHQPLPEHHVDLCVEEMLRYDSPLQLFERTATARVEVAGVVVEPGQKIAALLGAANRDPAVFPDADTFVPTRDPNPHLAFGVGLHHCLGSPLARMELVESMRMLQRRMPDLSLLDEPESRGTFVLRGYRTVTVGRPA